MVCKTFVVGVGLTKFEKPGSSTQTYEDYGREAAMKALGDAGISYEMVDAVVASYVYGESTSGQKVVYGLGLTGVPIFNTNNNCSSASCALMLSRLLVQSGEYSCVLALGFEKMERGLTVKWTDREHPSKKHFDRMRKLGVPKTDLPGMTPFTSDVLKIYAHGAREHMKRHGTTKEHYAKIAYKNHVQSQYNPNAGMQKVLSMQAIQSKVVCDPVTLAMCAMTACGGAAAVVCNKEFIDKHNLQKKSVEILAQQLATDSPSSFNGDLLAVGGYDMAKRASLDCLNRSGLTIQSIDVIELHDCFACNELFLYEALGLCKEGKGGELIDNAEWIQTKQGGWLCKIGGRWFVNTDGGLESKCHPIGATGLAQCAEIVFQLRGDAGMRQVEGARYGLQHNFGIGGAAVVTIYGKNFENSKL